MGSLLDAAKALKARTPVDIYMDLNEPDDDPNVEVSMDVSIGELRALWKAIAEAQKRVVTDEEASAMNLLADRGIPFKDPADALRIIELRAAREVKREAKQDAQSTDANSFVWLARDLAKDVIELRRMSKDMAQKAQAVLDAVMREKGIAPGGQKNHEVDR